MKSYEKILIDTIIVKKGYNIHQLSNPTWVSKGKMVYAYTNVANLLAINVTNDATYSDFIEYGCFYNRKIESSWRFLLNALVEKNFYISRYSAIKEFNEENDLVVYKTIDAELTFDQGMKSKISRRLNMTLYWNQSKFILNEIRKREILILKFKSHTNYLSNLQIKIKINH